MSVVRLWRDWVVGPFRERGKSLGTKEGRTRREVKPLHGRGRRRSFAHISTYNRLLRTIMDSYTHPTNSHPIDILNVHLWESAGATRPEYRRDVYRVTTRVRK